MHDPSQAHFARYPSLANRAILVTGGATGIGESIVTHFARQGSRVAFLDIQDEPARQLVRTLAAEGCPPPLYLHCDLTDIGALQIAVKNAVAALKTIDVLVNNAANDQRHSIESVTPESFDRPIAFVNLRPQFFTIQSVLPAMRASVLSIGLLCLHLSHGASAMFQSLGLKNEAYTCAIDGFAKVAAVIIFLGYISIPLAVLAGVVK